MPRKYSVKVNEGMLSPRTAAKDAGIGMTAIKSGVSAKARLGVVVVLYDSADVIEACLRSLLRQSEAIGRIVLVDNHCPKGSADAVEKTATALGLPVRELRSQDGSIPAEGSIELIRAAANLGYAGGVNQGLMHLHADPRIDYFWVLNPDCELSEGCADRLLRAADHAILKDGFALLGTRILYNSETSTVQSDGGVCCKWTGRCRNLNQGLTPADAKRVGDEKIDFVSGASMVASRRFLDQSGLMPEEYFLYYEEVAWARRRQELPLIICHDAVVQHHGGTAIGSGSPDRAASPVSSYFNFRNRMRFVAKHRPATLPVSYCFSLLKAGQTLLKGNLHSAIAAFRGMHGLPPSKQVRMRFDQQAQHFAFGSVAPVPAKPSSRAPKLPA